MVWVRTDGQRIKDDPVLTHQAQMDLTICQGELQKANLSGVTVHGGGMAGLAASIERGQAATQVGEGCMAQKGYARVPEDKAEATRTSFASVEAEKKRREEASLAGPKTKAKR
jgi:hypothetical protein